MEEWWFGMDCETKAQSAGAGRKWEAIQPGKKVVQRRAFATR
jgi:hypothetical protein